jgi:hypothetical protein
MKTFLYNAEDDTIMNVHDLATLEEI